MQHLSTAFLIIALAIVVNERVVNAKHGLDQMAVEAKNRAVTIVDGPKLEKHSPTQPKLEQQLPTQPKLEKQFPTQPKLNQTSSPELRPPSKPPLHLIPDKKFYYDLQHYYKNSGQKLQAPPRHIYTKEPLKLSNSVYKFNAMPMHRGNMYNSKPLRPNQPIAFAASNKSPAIVTSPKFSLPVQTINGIRTDFVRPPKISDLSTTTTTETPTTTRALRTKRIWPKRILEKMNATTATAQNTTTTPETNATVTNATDLVPSPSRYRYRYATTENPASSTTASTTRGYRRVTRAPKIKSTTSDPIPQNDWVPLVPSQYVKIRKTREAPQAPITKRSDMYLQPYGLLPVGQTIPAGAQDLSRKKMVFFRKRRQPLNPILFNQDYNAKILYPQLQQQLQPQPGFEDLQAEGSRALPVRPKLVTKIKHHHHHHHHRYVKTVEKPVQVPYKVEVEVPKPYPVEKKVPVPVPVEKVKLVDRPYPVPVEKKVPYPVTVKVPQPVPVKVVEKEYVPKPYPIIHHVPVVKHVEVKVPQPVPVEVEKRVPYPVQVPYPVEKQVPVPVPYEKRVPYPVPVKVFVPQPYPVEKRVPYPIEVKVKEPYEVIKHVQIKVPYPQPYPVRVPHPVPITVEKKVPYPVRVLKKVPVPVEVIVPHRIEIEKKIPIYIPKPYPVEKRIPYPVKVPYPVKIPVKVPVRVPVEVPVYIHHPFQIINDNDALGAVRERERNQYYEPDHVYYSEDDGREYVRSEKAQVVTSSPEHTVTVHGNTGFTGFVSRSDSDSQSTTPKPSKE